jgi:integrase
LTVSSFDLRNRALVIDLADAGIEYVDDSGRFFDFHALRGQCVSLLAATGAHPKTAQTILRHSDVNLTLNAYTHILRGQESEAVENLPDLSFTGGQSQKATGTDGGPVGEDKSAYKPAYKKR